MQKCRQRYKLDTTVGTAYAQLPSLHKGEQELKLTTAVQRIGDQTRCRWPATVVSQKRDAVIPLVKGFGSSAAGVSEEQWPAVPSACL